MPQQRYTGSHETFTRDQELKVGSERSFGLVFGAVFALLFASNLYHGNTYWRWWLGLSALFILTTFAAPQLLAPFNRFWARFGLLLSTVTGPLVLALLFYACIVPIGLLMRLTGKDPLRLRLEPEADTYWIRRDPPGPASDTLKNQF
jgi:Saxitoxin biosynthesis operon protein SxtJ